MRALLIIFPSADANSVRNIGAACRLGLATLKIPETVKFLPSNGTSFHKPGFSEA